VAKLEDFIDFENLKENIAGMEAPFNAEITQIEETIDHIVIEYCDQSEEAKTALTNFITHVGDFYTQKTIELIKKGLKDGEAGN